MTDGTTFSSGVLTGETTGATVSSDTGTGEAPNTAASRSPSPGLPAGHHPATGFPPANIPTAFADGITNISPYNGTARICFYRTDADVSGKDQYINQLVAQILMPPDGFVSAVLFLDKVLQNWIKTGLIDQNMVDHYKQLLERPEPAK